MTDYKKLVREGRSRHRPTTLRTGFAGEYEFADVCPTCGSKAPCQSAQLADAVESLLGIEQRLTDHIVQLAAERDALWAQLDGMTKALSRIVEVANFSAIEGVDGFVWRYDMPPGPIHSAIKELNQAGHPVESVGHVRLNPEIRADLIEFARSRIQMVWDDAGEVDATTLASNVVAAQEWLWLSLHFPVEVTDHE
jgi:hypothetical protein